MKTAGNGPEAGAGGRGHSCFAGAKEIEGGRELMTALALNLVLSAVDFIGAFLSGSRTLLAAGFHDFSDAVAMGIAYAAETRSRGPPSEKMSYGLKRLSVLAAILNAIALIAGASFVSYRAIAAFSAGTPNEVNGGILIAVGALAIALNGFAAWRLSTGGGLNVRAAFWHLADDVMTGGAAILAGVIHTLFHFAWADAVLSLAVSLIVLKGASDVLFEGLEIVMEAIPRGMGASEIRGAMEAVGGVEAAHHIHVWTIGRGSVALSAHVRVADRRLSQLKGVSARIRAVLMEKYKIGHATLEFECGPDPRDEDSDESVECL